MSVLSSIKILSIFATMALALSLIGCSQSTVNLPEGLYAPVRPLNPGGLVFEVGIEGILFWSAAGCLTLNDTQYLENYLVSLPNSVKVNQETIIFPGGEIYKIGDHFSGGGGFSESNSESARKMGVPEECMTVEIVSIDTISII